MHKLNELISHKNKIGIIQGIEQWEEEDYHCFAMEDGGKQSMMLYIMELFQNEYKQFVQRVTVQKQQLMASPNEHIVKIRNMFKRITESVQWLHQEQQCCHLDLSLENIVLNEFNEPKIIDFGLAFLRTNGSFLKTERVGKLRYIYRYLMCSIYNDSYLRYMAPEVLAKSQVYDCRKADVWSLGICLFMSLVGAPPFEAAVTRYDAFKEVMNGELDKVLIAYRRLGLVTANALDLLQGMLCDQMERMSIDEVVNHPFFNEVELISDELAQFFKIDDFDLSFFAL